MASLIFVAREHFVLVMVHIRACYDKNRFPPSADNALRNRVSQSLENFITISSEQHRDELHAFFPSCCKKGSSALRASARVRARQRPHEAVETRALDPSPYFRVDLALRRKGFCQKPLAEDSKVFAAREVPRAYQDALRWYLHRRIHRASNRAGIHISRVGHYTTHSGNLLFNFSQSHWTEYFLMSRANSRRRPQCRSVPQRLVGEAYLFLAHGQKRSKAANLEGDAKAYILRPLPFCSHNRNVKRGSRNANIRIPL